MTQCDDNCFVCIAILDANNHNKWTILRITRYLMRYTILSKDICDIISQYSSPVLTILNKGVVLYNYEHGIVNIIKRYNYLMSIPTKTRQEVYDIRTYFDIFIGNTTFSYYDYFTPY